MATYVYRCARDGEFEMQATMGTATPSHPCPTCASDGPRVFTVPRLGLADRRRGALLDRTARTASEPDVVGAVPPRTARPRPTTPDPAWSRLPRT